MEKHNKAFMKVGLQSYHISILYIKRATRENKDDPLCSNPGALFQKQTGFPKYTVVLCVICNSVCEPRRVIYDKAHFT